MRRCVSPWPRADCVTPKSQDSHHPLLLKVRTEMGFQESMRILIYSHDSFGLGHLRRCRAIAHSLVEHRRDISVLIISGSPIIGSYSFRSRVDYIRFPGVVKLRNGGYTPRGLDISIEDAIAIRETIVRSTANVFKPHIFLVDKEPLGLRGEVGDTLETLHQNGTRLVLGLRDVLDEGETLKEEWERKGAMQPLCDLYDDIWVYGSEGACDPLEGLDVPAAVRRKMTYTGYLRRSVNQAAGPVTLDGSEIDSPFILVTTGGGGDGTTLVDWVLRAYEQDPYIPHRAVIVFGPFMHRDSQSEFNARIERLDKVHAVDFVPNFEDLMSRSQGVVAMGGYNTVCEILSFDKPSLIVPRSVPRMEQTIRATRMEGLGLVKMLRDDGMPNPRLMAKAIRALPYQPKPSQRQLPGLLDGFAVINAMVDHGLLDAATSAPTFKVVSEAS